MRLWAAALLLSAYPAAAKDQVGQTGADEIVVTGRALPRVGAGLAAETIAQGQRIDRQASGRIETLLAEEGVAQFRRSDGRSAHPTSQGATIRGLGGNAASRMLVTLDGVPLNDPFGGAISWPSLDPARVRSVRLTRGGGVVENGAGALAGLVELSSDDGEPRREAGLWAGSRASFGGRGAIGAVSGDSRLLLTGQFEQSDGFIPIRQRDPGSADRRAPYSQGSMALRGIVPTGAGSELQLVASGFADRRSRGTDFSDNAVTGQDASLRWVRREGLPLTLMAYAQRRRFSSQFSAVSADRSLATPTLDQYSVPAEGWGASLAVQPAIGVLRLALGGDIRAVRGKTRERYSYSDGRFTRMRKAGGAAGTAGAFATARLPWSDGEVAAQARLDRWWIGDGYLDERMATGAPLTNVRFAARQGIEPSGRIDLLYRPVEPLSLRAAAYASARQPTLNELYRPYRVGRDAIIANAALTPERLRGAEAGASWRTPHYRINATLFVNRLEGAIANVTLGTGPGLFPLAGFVGAGGRYQQRRNLEGIDSHGVELSGTARIGRDWDIGATYVLADASVRDSRFGLDGKRPAQTARHSGSVRLGYADGGRDGGVTLRYEGARFDDDLNDRRVPANLVLDAALRWSIGPRLQLEWRGENLMDQEVVSAFSGAGAIERATPRTFWLGLRWADAAEKMR